MYKILGTNGQEFGPVNAETIRQWIAEGRLNHQSKIQVEGEIGWRILGDLPDFFGSPSGVSAPAGPLGEYDYDLNIGHCIGEGWNLFKNNTGSLLGTFVIYLVCLGVLIGLGMIPFIGFLFSVVSWVIGGPLLAGLYLVFLKTSRQQPVKLEDLFAGFNNSFGQLFLGNMVPGLLAGLCLVPFAVVGTILVVPSIVSMQAPSAGTIVIAIACLLVGLIPMMFFAIGWTFTLLLIIDRKLGFWEAMKTSTKMVRKHWWMVFALMLVIGIINVFGFILCLVGLLITGPISIGAFVYAYETIFNPPNSRNKSIE